MTSIAAQPRVTGRQERALRPSAASPPSPAGAPLARTPSPPPPEPPSRHLLVGPEFDPVAGMTPSGPTMTPLELRARTSSRGVRAGARACPAAKLEVELGPSLTLSALREALRAAEAELHHLRVPKNYKGVLNGAWDAFFGVQNIAKRGQTWEHLFDEVKLSQPELDSSWIRPVTLSPLNVALFRGHLFPDAFFMRSTMYFNAYRGQFQRERFRMASLAARLPYITLGLGQPPQVSKTGGATKLLELLVTNDAGDGYLTMYRGCSLMEQRLQLFIRDLLEGSAESPITREDRARLRRILQESSGSLADAMAGFRFERARPTRLQAAADLAEVLNGANDATFVGSTEEKAREFTDLGVTPPGTSADTIIRYRVPIEALRRWVEEGAVYVGVEFDAIEAGFGKSGEDSRDQSARFLLFRSIDESYSPRLVRDEP